MKSEDELRDAVALSLAATEQDGVPPFEKVWGAAERQVAGARRRFAGFAAAAAVAAVALVLVIQSPVEETLYVEVADLLGSTSWTAPSDVLLHQNSFDIYQEMPVLFESTDLAGGSLL